MSSLGEVSVTLTLQNGAFERSIANSIERLNDLQRMAESISSIQINTSNSVKNIDNITAAILLSKQAALQLVESMRLAAASSAATAAPKPPDMSAHVKAREAYLAQVEASQKSERTMMLLHIQALNEQRTRTLQQLAAINMQESALLKQKNSTYDAHVKAYQASAAQDAARKETIWKAEVAAYAENSRRMAKEQANFRRLNRDHNLALIEEARRTAALQKLNQPVNNIGADSSNFSFSNPFTAIIDGAKAVYDVFNFVQSQIVDLGMEYDRFEYKMSSATGGTVAAAREMIFVSSEAERLGIRLKGAADMYGTLAASAMGTSIEGQVVRKTFTAISEASVALKLTADGTSGALYAISQMISKGKVSMEELRLQLGERIPGAMLMAQAAMGKTGIEFDNMIRKGEVFTDEFLPKFADYIHNRFAKAAMDASDSVQGSLARLGTAWDNFRNRLYEGGVDRFFKGIYDDATNVLNMLSGSTNIENGANSILANLKKSQANDPNGLLNTEDARAGVISLQEEMIRLAASIDKTQVEYAKMVQKEKETFSGLDITPDSMKGSGKVKERLDSLLSTYEKASIEQANIFAKYGEDIVGGDVLKAVKLAKDKSDLIAKNAEETRDKELKAQEKWLNDVEALGKELDKIGLEFGMLKDLNTPQLSGFVTTLDAGLKGVSDRFASYLESSVKSQKWNFGDGASPTPNFGLNPNEPYTFMDKGKFSLNSDYASILQDTMQQRLDREKGMELTFEQTQAPFNPSLEKGKEMPAAYNMQLLQEQYDERIAFLESADALEVQREEKLLERKYQANLKYTALMKELSNKELQQRLQNASSISSGLQSIQSGLQSASEISGKKLFKTQQLTSAAIAMVDTYAAATSAMKTGITPAEKFAAFSAVFAKGLAAVSALKSVSVGGGSSGGGGGGGGGTIPDTRQEDTLSDRGQVGTTITIKVDGDVVDLDQWMEKKGSAAIRAAVGRNVDFGLQPA